MLKIGTVILFSGNTFLGSSSWTIEAIVNGKYILRAGKSYPMYQEFKIEILDDYIKERRAIVKESITDKIENYLNEGIQKTARSVANQISGLIQGNASKDNINGFVNYDVYFVIAKSKSNDILDKKRKIFLDFISKDGYHNTDSRNNWLIYTSKNNNDINFWIEKVTDDGVLRIKIFGLRDSTQSR